MSWISDIFRGKPKKESVIPYKPFKEIDYVQISTDWNPEPVSPEVDLKVVGTDLTMDIFLNHYVYDNFNEGAKAKIRFMNCSEYSLNSCNDEGYYYGQYRTNPNELPWGEFYEIKNGLDRNFPEPIVKIQVDNSEKRHFLLFFKDETFECLADDFELDFYYDDGKNNAQQNL